MKQKTTTKTRNSESTKNKSCLFTDILCIQWLNPFII